MIQFFSNGLKKNSYISSTHNFSSGSLTITAATGGITIVNIRGTTATTQSVSANINGMGAGIVIPASSSVTYSFSISISDGQNVVFTGVGSPSISYQTTEFTVQG